MRIPVTHIVFLLLLLAAAIGQGCRKNDNFERPIPSTLRTISHMGDAMVGYPLRFSSDATNAKKYHWDFGDGSTSAEPDPGHSFADTGVYVVRLMINDDTALQATYELLVFRAPANTYMLAGERAWRHSWGRWLSGVGDTTVYGPDVTMRIVYINPATIIFGKDTLKYVPVSPVDENHLNFASSKRGDEYLMFSTRTITRKLVFHHGPTDSISYSIVDHVSPRGYTYENYYSP